MKKIFASLVMLFVCVLSINAQVFNYKTQLFAAAYIQNDNKGAHNYFWSDWMESVVDIRIDILNNKITISPSSPNEEKEEYTIIDVDHKTINDQGGGQLWRMVARDQDGDQCQVRLRQDPKKKNQIYIDFSNIAWCYSGLVRQD